MKEAIERVIAEFETRLKAESEFRTKMMKKFRADGENQLGRIQALNYAIFQLKGVILDYENNHSWPPCPRCSNDTEK